MLAQTLAVSLLAASTLTVASQQHGAKRSRAHLNKAADVKRGHTGGSGARMTYYDTSVGLGSCGVWHSPSEYTVALNSAQLALYGSDYPSPACGQTITVSYNGKTAQATIQDECPTCPFSGLDMSQGLFEYFASTDVGVIYADWWYGSSSGDAAATTSTSEWVAPTSTYVAPTTSSSEWVAPTTSTSEWVAPTTTSSEWAAATTSSSEWVAPTTSSSEYAAPTSTEAVIAADITLGLNVAASASSSAEESSYVAPSSSYVAPSSSSTEDAYTAPTSTEAAWVAPISSESAYVASSTEQAWIAPSSTEQAWAPVASAVDNSWTSNAWTASDAEVQIFAANGSMCSSPSSILLFTNATLLYNGTTLDLLNAMTNVTSGVNATMPFFFGSNSTVSAIDASADADVKAGGFQNATAMLAANITMDQIVGYCFNSTLHPLVFSSNGTIANGTSPAGLALNATATFEDLLAQMDFNSSINASLSI